MINFGFIIMLIKKKKKKTYFSEQNFGEKKSSSIEVKIFFDRKLVQLVSRGHY